MTEPHTPDPSPAGTAPDGGVVADLAARARAKIVRSINRSVPGTVTLHYKSRDVTMDVSGDVALRMMVVLRRSRADGLDDVIDVTTSLALNGWVTVSTKGLLAITWAPGVDAAAAVDSTLLDSLEALDSGTGVAGVIAVLCAADGPGGADAGPDEGGGDGSGTGSTVSEPGEDATGGSPTAGP